MSPPPNKAVPYWFHAKRYGWGWGWPARREGWWALAVILVGLVGGLAALLATGNSFWGPFWIVGIAAAYLAICWWKGEPPRWRWGED